ncbi:DUF6778 family protein [Nioella ostreopsis]|uniref:DUF6778 family protein n=1 Tax=Nioella ostreopsis TaxID=2448479 RepID=UPI000FD9F5E7|nr:DUF6778 family protein [Nioella ostreopsis]
MKRIVLAFLGLAAMGVSACSTVPHVDVTQNITVPSGLAAQAEAADWQVETINILVPDSLTVSEANTIKPRSDIVWREGPIDGDRHQQVQELIFEAMEFALRPLAEEGTTLVTVELEVTRFHALTERARYTIGGEHEIEFLFTVRDAETGAALTGPIPVDLTFRAHGGSRAIAAEREGIYQRDRIQSQIIGWARQEFGLDAQGTEYVF